MKNCNSPDAFSIDFYPLEEEWAGKPFTGPTKESAVEVAKEVLFAL